MCSFSGSSETQNPVRAAGEGDGPHCALRGYPLTSCRAIPPTLGALLLSPPPPSPFSKDSSSLTSSVLLPPPLVWPMLFCLLVVPSSLGSCPAHCLEFLRALCPSLELQPLPNALFHGMFWKLGRFWRPSFRLLEWAEGPWAGVLCKPQMLMHCLRCRKLQVARCWLATGRTSNIRS